MGGAVWLSRCTVRLAWVGVAAVAGAYAVALVGNVDPVDPWAAAVAALLLLTAELGHAAAGVPRLDAGDAASRGRYAAAVASATLGGAGVAALLLAAAAAGGSGGAEVTALGGACAAAVLALLATTARRAGGG